MVIVTATRSRPRRKLSSGLSLRPRLCSLAPLALRPLRPALPRPAQALTLEHERLLALPLGLGRVAWRVLPEAGVEGAVQPVSVVRNATREGQERVSSFCGYQFFPASR